MLEEIGRGYGVIAWMLSVRCWWLLSGRRQMEGMPLIRQSSVLSLLPTLGFSMKNCVGVVLACLHEYPQSMKLT